MDTVVIRADNPMIRYEILRRLEGRLVPTKYTMRKPYDKVGRPPGYQQAILGYVESRYLHIAFDPISPRHCPLVFTTHLSQFSRYLEYEKWLASICGKHLNEVLAAPLSRFDICVDIALPFDEVQSCLSQPNITVCYKFDSRRDEKSFYFGANPKRTVAYERRVPSASIDWVAHQESIKPDKYGFQSSVRVEVRTWKAKLPIHNLSEIENVRTMKPFKHLVIEQVDEAMVEEVPSRKRHSLLAYKYRCSQVGAQAAKMEFNKSGNFAKTIGKYLKPVELDFKLAWKVRCNRFFGLKDT